MEPTGVWKHVSHRGSTHFSFLTVKPLEKRSSTIRSCGPANTSPRRGHGSARMDPDPRRAAHAHSIPSSRPQSDPGGHGEQETQPSPAAGSHGNHLGALKTRAVWVPHLKVLIKSVWFGMQPGSARFCSSPGDAHVKPALGKFPPGKRKAGRSQLEQRARCHAPLCYILRFRVRVCFKEGPASLKIAKQ